MEKLGHKIDRLMRTGDGDFGALALELFAYQFSLNEPYRAFCRAQQKTPDVIKRWQDIPAVPIRAFQSTELTTFPVGHAAAVFHSSATTTGRPGKHFLKTLSYYETALALSYQPWMAAEDKRFPMLILTPPPSEVPNSSLTWMFDVVRRRWGTDSSEYLLRRGRLDEPRMVKLLDQWSIGQQPVVLLGTTLAYLAFFDYLERQPKTWRLPVGSRLLDTGGMKTQTRNVTRADFVAQVGRIFSIPGDHCINEYGMCEMSSQFYSRSVDGAFEAPAWVRTQLMDPITGQPADRGLLQHLDLANVDSVSAIQTEDIGRQAARGFFLEGRASSAELKGCSLSAESYLKTSAK